MGLDNISEDTWLKSIGFLILIVVVLCILQWRDNQKVKGIEKDISFEDRNYICKEVKQVGFGGKEYIITCNPTK